MRVLGIIAEYNPFHNGHQYHLKKSLEFTGADFCVCVMSGNFMQRGELADWDKWQRAKMAVDNGVDLVLELPFAFACNNAEEFAYGGVHLLNGLGCVTDFSFGSESGDLEALKKIAEFLIKEPMEYRNKLNELLKTGLSFPSARSEALRVCGIDLEANLLQSSNNILAVEYLKQWILVGQAMKPWTIKREDKGYHSLNLEGNFASATAIRKQWDHNQRIDEITDFLPLKTIEVIEKSVINTSQKRKQLDKMLLYQLHSMDATELSEIYSVTEGLENRIKQAVLVSENIEDLINHIKSKRYTETRIKRMLLHSLLRFQRSDYERIKKEEILYGRVLGFSKKGIELLHLLKKTNIAQYPIYTNLKKQELMKSSQNLLFQYDILASDLYNLLFYDNIYRKSDFVVSPYYKK